MPTFLKSRYTPAGTDTKSSGSSTVENCPSSPQMISKRLCTQKKFSTDAVCLCKPALSPGGHSASVTVNPDAPLTGATLLRPSQPNGDMMGITLSGDIISIASGGMPLLSFMESL